MIKKQLLHLLLLAGFILGSHNGYIALWSGDSIDPDRIYPYRVSILPEADQQALEQKIPVRNDRDLQKILEDYLS